MIMIVLGCHNDSKKMNEIERLTKFNFPKSTELITYYDNYEYQVIFELKIDYKRESDFLSENNFSQIDTVTKFAATIFSSDELKIKDMNLYFGKNRIPKHKEIYLKKGKNFCLIADKNSNSIWGLIDYGE